MYADAGAMFKAYFLQDYMLFKGFTLDWDYDGIWYTAPNLMVHYGLKAAASFAKYALRAVVR